MKDVFRISSSLLVFLLVPVFSLSAADQETPLSRVLIVVGPSKHAPGTHEVGAGGRLLEYCLENMENLSGFEADVVYAWGEVTRSLEDYATVVFIGDNFPGERLPDSDQAMADLSAMMARGGGIVCLHFGTGLKNEDMGGDGDHPLLHWMGGYFATRCDHHQSIARHYDATIEAANARHPVSRGWDTFTLREEPYINNYFGPDNNRMLPGAFAVAVSMLPPEDPQREVIAWGIERSDTGRGIGITLPHFFKNWRHEDLRRLILNSIVWTAKKAVPAEGIQTTLPPLETFKPEAVEFVPRKK